MPTSFHCLKAIDPREWNRLAADNAFATQGTCGYAVAVGIDQQRAGDDYTYFHLTYNSTIADAIARSVRRVYYGRGLYDVKLRRGCTLENTWVYSRESGAGRVATAVWFRLASSWNRLATSVARTPAHFDSAVAVTAPAEPATPKRRSREGEWAFGPGLVHLLGTVGPNDLIFNSIVAANYGYSQLWACGWLSKTMIALAIALSLALTYQSLTDLAARLLSHRAS